MPLLALYDRVASKPSSSPANRMMNFATISRCLSSSSISSIRVVLSNAYPLPKEWVAENAERHRSLAEEFSVPFARLLAPPVEGGDWNDVLSLRSRHQGSTS